MIRIPWKTNSLNEDTIMFGDDQGTVYTRFNFVTKDIFLARDSKSSNVGKAVVHGK